MGANWKLNKRSEKAQGLVEFALVLPVFLLIVFGIFEFGRLFFGFIMVSTASREGARYGSAVGKVSGTTRRYEDCVGIRAAATRIGTIVGVQDSDIAISYDDGTNVIDATCPPSPSSNVGLGDRIVVTVSWSFQPVAGILNLPVIPIASTTSRTIIRNVGIKGTPAPPSLPPGADTPTPSNTPTETFTPTPTPTDENSPTPSNTPTETRTPTVTNTPLPGSTDTYTPSPTPTNTPTITQTPSPTPIPTCVPGNYSITNMTDYTYDKKAFYSVYLGIQNSSGNTVAISEIEFYWPPPTDISQGSRLPLKEVRFGIDFEWNKTPAVIWDGWDWLQSYTAITICETCTESFDGNLADRQITSGGFKNLQFVFSDSLKSSYNEDYTPNPFPYKAKITLDNTCYIETVQTQLILP